MELKTLKNRLNIGFGQMGHISNVLCYTNFTWGNKMTPLPWLMFGYVLQILCDCLVRCHLF